MKFRLIGGRGRRGLRAAPTSGRVKGERPRGPRVGGSGKARAVPWLSWRPSVQPGDVDPCGSLTGGPVLWVHTETGARAWAGVFG